MSFENGYNINDYIQSTIKIYKTNKNIFNKAINILTIFMQKSDWPMCYNDFKDIVSQILGDDPEMICRNYYMFKSQKDRLSQFEGWNFNLEDDFREELDQFSAILNPIIENYYSYINNPLGINKIIQIDKNSNNKLIRILRVDGQEFDLRMSNYEIKQFISTLNDIIKE
ncbi:hypothetical protein [Clostridium butyricum]|uniref:hypothetical protein n=1 Tax=Clostridium butyricum TaxID=1492 RepID=UPI0006E5781A|nr:hypothetical protein AK964_21135 [Clostridium butyricum]